MTGDNSFIVDVCTWAILIALGVPGFNDVIDPSHAGVYTETFEPQGGEVQECNGPTS